jgi:hypothetical protein
MAFGGDGAYLLGECGLLGFDVTSFEFLTAVPLGSLEDLEVGPDGSAWIGQVDVNVQQWTGRELIEHGLESPDLAITEDGTVLAWSLHDRQVVRYDGSEWVDEVEPGENARFEVGPDGTLWARVDGWVAIDDINLNVGSLMSYDGESWTTHETPELVSINIAGFTPEGAIMLAGHVFAAPRLEQRIYLVADGDGWTRYDINPPTLEELGIQPIVTENDTMDGLALSEATMAEDGTLWFRSSWYGVFSFAGEEWTRYTTEDGLASNRITVLEVGPDGSLWFGSEDAGVTRYLPEQ